MTELTAEQKQRLIDAYIEFEKYIEEKRKHIHKLLAEALKHVDQKNIDKILLDIKDSNI